MDSKRVLLVEDQAAIRGLFAEILESEGYEVHALEDGLRAIELLRDGSFVPDVMVVDAMLPGANGGEVFRAARKTNPGARFLLVSGHGESIVESLGAGGTSVEFLGKPFKPADLVRKIRALLEVG